MILQSNYKESSIGPIPYDWEIVKMEKVCEKIIDCLHSKKPTFIKKSDKIYLEVVNIGDSGELNLETVNYINNKDFNFWTKRIVPKHKDIIITKTGRIGAVAMVPLNLYCCIGRNQVIIRADNNKILSEFLLYYLLSPQFNKELKMQKMLGTILESLHVKNIPKIRVLLPELKEQYQIVKLLKPLYEKKELNDQINKTLEEMAQTIFKHWFIDFEFPNENGEPYKASGGDMIDSELGPIPKGWVVISFKEIIKISSGKRPKIMKKEKDKGFNIPLIGASSTMGYVSETLYAKPILIIGRVGTHGIVQRIKGKSWPSDNTLVIQPEYYEYTYQILKNIDYQSLNRGSTQPLITQTDIKKYKIVLPKYNLLRNFEKSIGSLFQLINKNKEENIVLSEIREELLHKLMSGEVRVPINNKNYNQLK